MFAIPDLCFTHTYWASQSDIAIFWKYWCPDHKSSLHPLAHGRAHLGCIVKISLKSYCGAKFWSFAYRPRLLWTELGKQRCGSRSLLGCSPIMTTACRALVNDSILLKKTHSRHTKLSFWRENLAPGLLGIISSVNNDLQSSTHEVVCPALVRLSVEHFRSSRLTIHSQSQFRGQLFGCMNPLCAKLPCFTREHFCM